MSLQFTRKQAVLIILTNWLLFAVCQQDESLRSMAEEFWMWKLEEFPALRNPQAEHLESFLIRDFNRRVEDCKDMLSRSLDIDSSNLTQQDKTTLKLLQYQLRIYIEGHEWIDYGALNPLNTLEGIHRLSHLWVARSTYNTTQGISAYIRKLHRLPNQIEQVQGLMDRAVQLNRTNHNVSMKGVLSDIRLITSADPEETSYYTHIHSLDELDGISQTDKLILRSEAKAAIRSIQQAFERLSLFISDRYLPHTRKEPGVWSLSNGAEYYRNVLKWHLSTDLHPETVHYKGQKEVRRIKQLMEGIMVSLGHDGDLASFLQHTRTQPQFYNHTEEEFIQLFRTALDKRIQPILPLFFNNIDRLSDVSVQGTVQNRVAAAYGHNTVLVNANSPETRPYFTVLTMTLHEGNPGHHLQSSIIAQQNLPNFRKIYTSIRKYAAPFHFPYYTAYVEGWGLYAEYLGHEMGLFNDDPYELFGRYCYEIFRACRLVVDTGIHYKGWSREEAIEYLQQYSIMSRDELEIEVDRYITWPGQACAYKVGEMEIIELRHKVEVSLGPNFDIKEFHDVILKNGAVPLDVLGEIVDQYIDKKLTSGGSVPRIDNYMSVFCLITCYFVKIYSESIFVS